MKKLENIQIIHGPEIYPTKDLIKINKIIKKPALTFFNNCKKKNKKIKDKYNLQGKDWEKYNKLDREIYFGYHSSDTIESILVDREKKKN